MVNAYFHLVVIPYRYLPRRKREFLRKFLKRNPRIVEKREVLIFRNDGLGAVRLLQLVNKMGRDSILEIRPLGTYLLGGEFPSEYRELARSRKLGRRQRVRLLRSPGLEAKI